MDLSKLPKLSETAKAEEGRSAASAEPAPANSSPSEAHPVRSVDPVQQALPAPGTGLEIWISLIIAVIFMMLGANYGRYLKATVTHQPFHTKVTWQTPERFGQEVDYFDLEGYTALDEMSRFYFGVAMVFEAVMLFAVSSKLRGKTAIVFAALLVALASTALNVYAAYKLFNFGVLPLLQVVAIGFGGYMAYYEWALLQHLQRQPAK